MQLAGFEASILVNGVKLQEYNISIDSSGETATCWIPSEAGQCFIVSWNPLSGRNSQGIASRLYTDGISVGGCFSRINDSHSRDMTGRRTSGTTIQPFVFSSLETTDDDTYLNRGSTKGLGDIIVEFWEARAKGKLEFPSISSAVRDEKVHERSKKAMVHQIKFGQEEQIEFGFAVDLVYVRKFATLVYKYRSIDILRAEGIAPSVPKDHNNHGKKRKVEDLDEDRIDGPEESDDDGDEVKAELKVLQERINAIQSRIANKRARPNSKIKKEPRRPIISGEIIDLTQH